MRPDDISMAAAAAYTDAWEKVHADLNRKPGDSVRAGIAAAVDVMRREGLIERLK